MASKTIRVMDSTSAKPKTAWFNKPLSEINNTITSTLGSNIEISSITLRVSMNFDGAGGLANVYGRYGFGSGSNISTSLLGKTKITKDATDYSANISGYINSDKNGISTSYGSYLSVYIETTNIIVNLFRVDYIELDVVYQIPTFTVSLNKGVGCASVSGAGTYNKGASVVISATSLPGYDIGSSGIVKWQDSAGNTVFNYTPQTFNIYQNYSLTCNLYPNSYFVRYNANGGGGSTNMYDESIKYDVEYTIRSNEWFTGQEITLTLMDGNTTLNKLVKNKTFTGWLRRDTSEAYSVGKKVKNLTTQHLGTIHLDAQWAQPVFTLPAPAPKEGYDFLGWRYGSNLLQPGASFKIDKDTTIGVSLKAEWKKQKMEEVYGGNDKAGVYVANTECKAVYVGNTKVYG